MGKKGGKGRRRRKQKGGRNYDVNCGKRQANGNQKCSVKPAAKGEADENVGDDDWWDAAAAAADSAGGAKA